MPPAFAVNLAQNILVFGLRGYRTLVSPLLTTVFGPMGCGCRFTPTCSCYAIEAVRTHGALRGSWLAVCRVGRCHPWGGQGEDPVPPRKSESLESGVANRRNAREPGHDDLAGHSCSLSLACGPGNAGAASHLISRLHGS